MKVKIIELFNECQSEVIIDLRKCNTFKEILQRFRKQDSEVYCIDYKNKTFNFKYNNKEYKVRLVKEETKDEEIKH